MMNRRVEAWIVLAAIVGIVIFLFNAAKFTRQENEKEKKAEVEELKQQEEGNSVHLDHFELTDNLGREAFGQMDELHLRSWLIKTASEILENPDNPELYVTKAMIVEGLTRFDEKNNTSNWNRAAYHYDQAITKWQLIVDKDNELKEWALKRIAILRFYRGKALLNEGDKLDEAIKEFETSAQHSYMKERAREALEYIR